MSHAVNPHDGVRIVYSTEGAGPPLVLLHGSTLSSEMWRGLGYVDALKDDYQLILIDARGHGQSEKPRDEDAYAIQHFVSDVAAVLDDLKIDRAHIGGYSLGGRVALACGVYLPLRCSSLIIGGGTYRTSAGTFDRATYPGALDSLARAGIEGFIEGWNSHFDVPLPPSVLRTFEEADVEALVAYLRRMEHPESFEDQLPELTTPALLFAGSRDTDRLEDSEVAARLMPNATLVEIPDEDHASTLVQIEKVLPHIQTFLATQEEAASEWVLR